jgi:hypothetical protein
VYHFRITALFLAAHSCLDKSFIMSGELAGIRTQDPRLKRALLYQLSYELVQWKTKYAFNVRRRNHRWAPGNDKAPTFHVPLD